LPGVHLIEVLLRAASLCAVGIFIYVTVASILGVRELAEVQGILLRRLRL
jgi:hypothetical protein